MTQMPPPPGFAPSPDPAYGVPPRQTNVLAVVSLVCGIIGCLVITPLVAIVTGILGLGAARRLGNGKGMAITGILLGLIWIVGGLGLGGLTYFGIKKGVAMVKQPAIEVINAAVDGDLTKAQPFTTLSESELQELSGRLKSYGHCTDLSVNSFNGEKNTGTSAIRIAGTATFEKAGDKGFSATATPQGDQLKITELNVD